MYDDRGASVEGRDSAFEDVLRAAIDRSYAGLGWELAEGSHLSASAAVEDPCPETAALRELLETGAAHLRRAERAGREQSRQAAVQARALAAFARCRPGGRLDRPAEEVGAAAAASRAARPDVVTEVSEWAVDEVMVALGLSSRTAGRLLVEALTLVEDLPATLAAVEDGVLGWPAARMLVDRPPLGEAARAEVEAEVLAGAAGRTLAQLTAATRRAVLRVDAVAAARRLAAAVRERAVRVFPGDDGTATLSAVMSGPVAAACYAALEAYAEDCVTPGDERTKGQRMVDCLADLILRPGTNPPVQVRLTLVAPVDTMRGGEGPDERPGGEEPGEVNGEPVPAVLVRELAYTLGLLPRPEQVAPAARSEATTTASATEEAGERGETGEPAKAGEPAEAGEPEENTGPEETGEPADIDALTEAREAGEGESANERAARNLAALFGRPTTDSALAEPPTIAVVEAISGELLALTDATQIRRAAACHRPACRTGRRPCTHPPRGLGLGPPAPSTSYAPADRLDTFVRFRDRRCRFPGCRAPAVRCDLDHNTPWPHGATSADNLCCLCRHHHRLSHQAPGWTMRRLDDGGLHWTTPGGQQLTTYPPRYGTDDHPPPAEPPAPPKIKSTPARPLRERVLGRPRDPDEPDDDPPTF